MVSWLDCLGCACTTATQLDDSLLSTTTTTTTVAAMMLCSSRNVPKVSLVMTVVAVPKKTVLRGSQHSWRHPDGKYTLESWYLCYSVRCRLEAAMCRACYASCLLTQQGTELVSMKAYCCVTSPGAHTCQEEHKTTTSEHTHPARGRRC